MITATITAIDYADAALTTIKVTWSHGETQTAPSGWTGFFRGATGKHVNGEEVQYIDGTGLSPDVTVLDAFAARRGVVGDYIPEASDEQSIL